MKTTPSLASRPFHLVSSDSGVQYSAHLAEVGRISVRLADRSLMQLCGGCVEWGPNFRDRQFHGDRVGRASKLEVRTAIVSRF